MTSEIWIAEDDRSLRWVMEKAIRREEMQVRSFENGEDLLEALNDSKPEIIISDIRMPGMDGLELLQRIHAEHQNLPIIITTGTF
jgi:two-component system nitrogen regulation response regulator GlnG